MQQLEDAGHVEIEKSYRGRRPVTWYELTDSGRAELRQHIANLMRLIGRAE